MLVFVWEKRRKFIVTSFTALIIVENKENYLVDFNYFRSFLERNATNTNMKHKVDNEKSLNESKINKNTVWYTCTPSLRLIGDHFVRCFERGEPLNLTKNKSIFFHNLTFT